MNKNHRQSNRGKTNHGKWGIFLLIPLVLVLLPLAAVLTGCARTAEQEPVNINTAFARYQEAPVQVQPAVEPYTVEPGLANITNKDMFELSPAAQDLLVKNGFVVVPNDFVKEYFGLYEMNRYQPVPLFITTDSVLHNYHLFFNHLLRVVETGELAPELKILSRAMLDQTLRQYTALRGTEWENAAKRNAGFFAVACKLLDPETPVPAAVKDEVAEELALIEAHQGIAVSPLMNPGGNRGAATALKEDYSQYVPRGHYDRSDLLQAYFKTMMWYGRLTFRLDNEDETKSAALIALALDDANNRQHWERIYTTTNFFVGRSDDITYHRLKDLFIKSYGAMPSLQALTDTPDQWNAFREAARALEPPALNQEIKGFRFMGQRFTLDADIFQRLIYREVKENPQGQFRMLPKGLDIPAVFGSAEAYAILEAAGETAYRDYPENMNRLQERLAGLDADTWIQNLYWGWLHTLKTLIGEKPEGYPSFMRNQAWTRKELNTFLGSWTELKHDTVLYAKQVYAEAGGGGGDVDDRGYVEPNPHLYARLAALVRMTEEGLAARDLLNERDRASLERMEQMVLTLKTIAEKELSNNPLTDEEYDFIRFYGGQLEHFWLEALRDVGVEHRSACFDRPAALVADVATDPAGGRVLEEATGPVFHIYAAVPVDGKLRLAVGGVYSYYEFPWPLNDRLTDKKWHEMINNDRTPPLPAWTGAFTAP
jgi:hypothetical protein